MKILSSSSKQQFETILLEQKIKQKNKHSLKTMLQPNYLV